jgi:glycosyl-4,4'-diaponeurosporenoate acyltransferase
MRIIILPSGWTILLCFVVWPILQITAALICFILPDWIFSPNAFFFRTQRFEKQGRVYDRVFRVSRWKHLLPDGGMVWKKRGFKKKHLESFSQENLNRFLVESARGELTHLLAIFPFWVFWFFTPPNVPWIMLVYALLVNLPCIIAQRYNRPRVQRLLNKKKESFH